MSQSTDTALHTLRLGVLRELVGVRVEWEESLAVVCLKSASRELRDFAVQSPLIAR